MRNCFVPKCDNMCKNQPRRMMFLPPKDPDIFKLWKEVLPKKREFKIIDKVCERHFLKDDIITTFDHIINGQLLQMERGRPRLKRTAIPQLNLLSHLEAKTVRIGPNMRGIRLKKKKPESSDDGLYHQSILKDLVVSEEKEKSDMTIEEVNMSPEPHKVPEATSSIEVDSRAATTKNVKDEVIFNEEIVLEQFETLYDDIFEVTLPNTLWGIHRDPERQFIAFTCFDAASMRNTKCVFLSNIGCLRVTIHSKIVSEQVVSDEITTEFVSNILNEIEDTSFCLKSGDYENGNCEVIAAAGSTYCGSCS